MGLVNVRFRLKRLENSTFLCYDAPTPWQCTFQDPATPVMEGIIDLHHDLMFFIVIVITFVFFIMFRIIYLFDSRTVQASSLSRVTHNTQLEIIWTVIPGLILIIMAVPSFGLLYSMDEIANPGVTIKVIGNQ
jgi:cytochrome c oxidase subunit 2